MFMKTNFATVALLFAFSLSLKAAPIPFEEVSLLVRMHEPDSFITQQLTQRRLVRAFTPQQEATLKSQGASDSLIQALRNPTASLSLSEAAAFEIRREQQNIAMHAAAAAEAAAYEARQKAIQVAAAARAAAIAQATTPPTESEADTHPIRTSANGIYPIPSRPRVVGIPIPDPITPNITRYPANSPSNNATIVRPDYLGGARATDNFGNTTRIQPDSLGGFRASDNNGNVTRYRSDYLGGFRGTDDNGNTTRIRPNYPGGFRTSDDNGNSTRYRPDYLGGFRGTDDYGNTTRIRPDYLGGYRINR